MPFVHLWCGVLKEPTQSPAHLDTAFWPFVPGATLNGEGFPVLDEATQGYVLAGMSCEEGHLGVSALKALGLKRGKQKRRISGRIKRPDIWLDIQLDVQPDVWPAVRPEVWPDIRPAAAGSPARYPAGYRA